MIRSLFPWLPRGGPRGVALRLVPAILLGAFLPIALSPSRADWPENEGTLDAYWSVSGTVHILEREGEISAAAGRLTGTATIRTSQGPIPSFETDCVFFSTARKGGGGQCVWTGATGDQIYVDLSSQGPAGFGRARGVFAGGTGRFEGLTGSFEFEWNYSVGPGTDALLDGHSVQMRGRYKLR